MLNRTMKKVFIKHIQSGQINAFHTDLDLNTGDTVVYESATGTKGTFLHVGVVWAGSGNNNVMPPAENVVVCKVDMEIHKERLKTLKKVKEIKSKLNKKIKEFKTVTILNLIASVDSETEDLMNEYYSLLGDFLREDTISLDTPVEDVL